MNTLRIMLVDDVIERREALLDQFSCSECNIVAAASTADNLSDLIKRYQPDVIIVDMDASHRNALENLRTVQSTIPRPMVMFSQDDDSETIRRAVKAGVSAYVVDGIQAKRVRPILDAAIARFRQYRELAAELDMTKNRLSERKMIERAKGIIMSQRNLTEADAYQLLRKAAMDRNLRMAEVAESILSAVDLLGASSH